MQIIAQLQQIGKGKQRSYSRAYESPRNGQFTQYSSRKNGGKAVSSTGTGVPNQRRINQTIDVGATLEHLDLDVGMASPNEQQHSTIQPTELTSPMGVAKIPHQPGAQNIGIN